MSEWISVKERLPRPETPVWIYWRDREVLIGYYCYYGKEMEYKIKEGLQHEGWYSIEDHKCRWAHWWMPIEPKPEPPK